ncbi:MAG TPA: hypothetical protein VHW00_24740 [Thermoanaerobaculia bacterium]|nr:hypothetical protein [Thermoanaerobaculia bacterium]
MFDEREQHVDKRTDILDPPTIERLLAFTEHRLNDHHSGVSRFLTPHDYVLRAVARMRDEQSHAHPRNREDAFAHLCRVIEMLIDDAEMSEKRRNLRMV